MRTYIRVSEVKEVGAQRGEHSHGPAWFIREFWIQSMGLKSSIN